jgi:hypothetical protein
MHPAVLILMLALAQAGPHVCVSTDRGFYSPGDQVIIQVTAAGIPSNETLWLYVDRPDGRNLNCTELPAPGGTFVVSLPHDALEGSYAVTVMWDHRYVQTGFIVESQSVPEFPFPLVVLLGTTIATLTLLGRKAGAPPETASTDSGAHMLC